MLNNKTSYFWSDKPVDDLVCSLSPLSGPLAGAAAPLVGIDRWEHIEHIKRAWVLSRAHIGISTIHIRNPQADIFKNCNKEPQIDGLIVHTNWGH